jgi:hypothetical protein
MQGAYFGVLVSTWNRSKASYYVLLDEYTFHTWQPMHQGPKGYLKRFGRVVAIGG